MSAAPLAHTEGFTDDAAAAAWTVRAQLAARRQAAGLLQPPGSPGALQRGCRCNPIRNAGGRGSPHPLPTELRPATRDGRIYYVNERCQLHNQEGE